MAKYFETHNACYVYTERSNQNPRQLAIFSKSPHIYIDVELVRNKIVSIGKFDLQLVVSHGEPRLDSGEAVQAGQWQGALSYE